jgi:hypothetical protein
MVSVELLAGLLIGYTLLYLLVSYLLRSRSGNGGGPGASSTPDPGVSRSAPVERDVGNDEDAPASSTVVCGVCRAENEAGYTYCRSCISELGGAYDRASRSR